VHNSIVWGNRGPSVGTQYIHSWQISGDTERSYSTVEGAGGNTPDPLFVDDVGPDGIVGTLDDDLSLSDGSPAVDAGRNALLPLDPTDIDLDGDRTENLPVDLRGNPRRSDDPLVPDTGVGQAPIVDRGAHEKQ